MSAARAAADARSTRRLRKRLMLGGWAMAASLIVGQLLILRHLNGLSQASAGTSAEIVVPSDAWRLSGTFLPLLLIGAVLILQICWLRGSWAALSVLGIFLLFPISLLCMYVAGVGGPTALGAARLSDGQRFILAIEPVMTDSVYTLYEEADWLGLTWRQVSWLDYSEDGRFTGGEHLAVSPDEHWLLVARAGIWTDCFRLEGGRPVRIADQPAPLWTQADYEAEMRLRSARIATLTGMRP